MDDREILMRQSGGKTKESIMCGINNLLLIAHCHYGACYAVIIAGLAWI